MALRHLAQPFFGDLAEQLAGDRFDALEVGRKRAVEAVELGLVLDQRRTRQVVEGTRSGST
jgi:hypothetical protein